VLSHHFSIQAFGLISVFLIVLWSLSPIAGQASLRVIETRNITDTRFDATWSVSKTAGARNCLGDSDTTIDSIATIDLKASYFTTMANNQETSRLSSGLVDNNFYPVLPMLDTPVTLSELQELDYLNGFTD